MNILFDHQTFRSQRYGGISFYISQLIKGINRSTDNCAKLTGPYFENENLSKGNYDLLYMNRLLWTLMPTKGLRTSNIFASISLQTQSYDIFHATYYDPYFLKNIIRNKPWTFTYHDMTHEVLSSRFPVLTTPSQKNLVKNKEILVRGAPKVITISELTKSDIINYYQVEPEKIKVVYHGNPYEYLNFHDISPLPSYNFPYLLFVGHRSAYKNFILLIKAIAPLLKRYSIHLVCAGSFPFTMDEAILLKKHRLEALVHHCTIHKFNLPNLYRHAIAFIFPSLYEGFGLPILEAFSCKCPCILSETGALPEIAGKKAAIYFNPNDTDSMSAAVEAIIVGNREISNYLINQGTDRLKFFQWQKTVNETMSIYQSLVNE